VKNIADVQHRNGSSETIRCLVAQVYGDVIQKHKIGFGVNSGWTLHVTEFKVTAILPPKREVDYADIGY
jgi:hypothetical protein